MPYKEVHAADHPMSFYAATKKANEAMAHSYAHLFGLPITLFRFFTVYGPWGRPDMVLFKFVNLIRQGKPIDLYNYGEMLRDFTFIDDLVEGIARLIDRVPEEAASGRGVGRFGVLDLVGETAREGMPGRGSDSARGTTCGFCP